MGAIGMNVSWLLGPLLQTTLLFFMVRRKLYVPFPRFFSYIVFQLVKSGVLFGIYRYHYEDYFDAYWTGNAISVLLSVTVMDEILQNLLRQYKGLQRLTTLIFRWSCGLLLLLSILTAFTSQQTGPDRVISMVLSFDRSVRFMQCGLFLLLLVLCKFLRKCWLQHVFGISLGFGVFASIELILVSTVMRFGEGGAAIISLINSAAYNGVTLLWVLYLRRSAESISLLETVPRAVTLDLSIGAPAEAKGSEFLSMVEEAVDRVLSRSNWPRPSVRGSQIIGHQPEREERN